MQITSATSTINELKEPSASSIKKAAGAAASVGGDSEMMPNCPHMGGAGAQTNLPPGVGENLNKQG